MGLKRYIAIVLVGVFLLPLNGMRKSSANPSALAPQTAQSESALEGAIAQNGHLRRAPMIRLRLDSALTLIKWNESVPDRHFTVNLHLFLRTVAQHARQNWCLLRALSNPIRGPSSPIWLS